MMDARKTILVIDDSWLILEMVETALAAEGFDVLAAKDLGELDRKRAQHRADLVILDVQMPEAFGDELGEMLREVRNENAPMLLFSSLADEELDRRARDARLAGWVSKRQGMRVLIERVKALLGEAA